VAGKATDAQARWEALTFPPVPHQTICTDMIQATAANEGSTAVAVVEDGHSDIAHCKQLCKSAHPGQRPWPTTQPSPIAPGLLRHTAMHDLIQVLSTSKNTTMTMLLLWAMASATAAPSFWQSSCMHKRSPTCSSRTAARAHCAPGICAPPFANTHDDLHFHITTT
jgi:hypothetical protein